LAELVPKRAVVFDFDGVIGDTDWIQQRAFRQTFRELGRRPPPRWYLLYKYFWHDPRYEKHFQRVGIRDGTPEYARARQIFSSVADPLYENAPVFKGIGGTLRKLKGQGLKFAIVSGTPAHLVMRTLEANGLSQYFDPRFIYHTRSSEKTAGIAKALSDLDVQNTDAVVVGDSPLDIEGGKANHTHTLAVSYGYFPSYLLKKSKPSNKRMIGHHRFIPQAIEGIFSSRVK
jgi:phosphoglycolate phosphatase-like HAD superfamily hydrolase